MRLGQLARKLGIRPTEIVEFLGTNQIQIDDGSNTRLADEHVVLVTRQFAPAKGADTVEVRSDMNETSSDAEPERTIGAEIGTDVAPDETFDDKPATKPDQVEVIKAPKIELAGLKVLGKVELPEPKKAENRPEQAEISLQPEIEKQRRKERKANGNRKQNQRPRKNPIAAQREREAEALQQKREEEAVREKQRRTQNYQKRVRMSPPTKAMKIVNEPVMEMSAEELAEEPKTWYGKFFKWLTQA